MHKMQEAIALEIYRSMTRDMSDNPLITPLYFNAAWSALHALCNPTEDMLAHGVGLSDWILPEAIGSTKEDYIREMRCGFVSAIKKAMGEKY